VIRLWNDLPADDIGTSSLPVFKLRVKCISSTISFALRPICSLSLVYGRYVDIDQKRHWPNAATLHYSTCQIKPRLIYAIAHPGLVRTLVKITLKPQQDFTTNTVDVQFVKQFFMRCSVKRATEINISDYNNYIYCPVWLTSSRLGTSTN